MARSPTPQIGRPTPIRPVAAPVNTYVRPPDPAPSSLHDLAEGLAVFDSGLSSWLGKRQAEQDKADAVRGEAAFNRNNQVGWAEAVASGAVPAHSSPVFVEAYKTAQGSHMGVRLREQFNTAYANWEGRNSEDPEAFQTFLSDFISSNIPTDDPEILAGLNPHIEALTESAYTTYSTDRANTIYNNHVNTQAALVGDIIDHASIQGINLETGTDYEVLQADIMEQRQIALDAGIRMADFDKHLVSTIAAKAIEHGDPQLLEMLEQTLPGYDVALSSLPEFRDVKATTVAALEAEARRRMKEDADRQEAEDKAREEAIQRGVIGALAEDPTAEIPEEVLEEWEVYNPEARLDLARARETLLNDTTQEDPEDLLLVERMIQEGATAADILELAADGVIKDPATFRTLIDRVNRRQEALSGILSEQTAKRFLSTIKQRTTPDQIGAMFAPEGLTDEGLEATRDYETMLIEWSIENPNATAYEREQFLNDAGELILKRMDLSDTSSPQYVSPEDAERMRRENAAALEETVTGISATAQDMVEGDPEQEPQAPVFGAPTPAAQAGATIGAAAPSPEQQELPAPDPETVELFGQDTPPNLQQMDEATRMVLEQRAESLGITPEEYSMSIWTTIRESMGLPTEVPEQPVPTPSPTPQGPQSQANPEIFDPAKAVSPILDFIGESEGTDRGAGYDETFGYGRYTDGPVELTNMSISEVFGLQERMLSDPENRHNSSAVGRFQITRPTLEWLTQKFDLTGNEKFTPELQDRFAVALLRRRGLDKWLKGDIETSEFMSNLSKEWASLPNASGLGHYADQQKVADAQTAREVLESLLTQPGMPSADIVRLGYAAETTDTSSGIGGALDASLHSGSSLEIAERFLGMNEGNQQQAQTLSAFFRRAGGQNTNPTASAWCAAFANAVLGEMGYEGTGSLAARSFLNFGKPVAEPARGDVVVFWRESPSSWKGHVAFFDRVVTRNGRKYVRVLGGNQSNSVSYAEYPVDQVLGYRRPENMNQVI